MTYSNKVYLIKTSLVLFTLGICAYIYENTLKEFNVSQEYLGISYIVFIACCSLFGISLVLAREPKITTKQVKSNTLQSSPNFYDTFLQEFRIFSNYTASMIKLLEHTDSDNLDLLKKELNKNISPMKEALNTLYSSTKENEAQNLLKKYMEAYFKLTDKILLMNTLDKQLIVSTLNSLSYSDKKDKALLLIVSKLTKRNDPFFDITLAR